MRTMFLLLALLLAALLPALPTDGTPANPPYIGEWSNRRGEVLVITLATLQFQRDKAVPYRAIPRATGDSAYKLQITAREPVNYFQKFLWLSMRGESEMTIESFDSISQIAAGDTGVQHWFRDK